MEQHALDMGVRQESLRVTGRVVNTAAEAEAVGSISPVIFLGASVVLVDAAEAMGARCGRQGGVHAGKGAKAAVFSLTATRS
jgi:dTDP-4-amino-4,6-dideoxygalactose transaminase